MNYTQKQGRPVRRPTRFKQQTDIDGMAKQIAEAIMATPSFIQLMELIERVAADLAAPPPPTEKQFNFFHKQLDFDRTLSQAFFEGDNQNGRY